MPELPEVETIAGYLRNGSLTAPSIIGEVITGVRILWERTLAYPSPSEFLDRILGQKIEGIGRRGKFLMLQLSRDVLMYHLRMSGDLNVRPISTSSAPHDRLLLMFQGDHYLAFNDTRKFGRAWLVSDPEQVFKNLGPEPLAEDFTADDLYRKLQKHRRQIKPLLLDQAFLAGMGNIYSDEALHLAGLNPLSLSHNLSIEQAEKLWVAIRRVLNEGIRLQGASIDWVYRGGDFQNYFRVYRRTGLPCPECQTPVRRILVGQRSTHYCPQCQPGPEHIEN
jgi:formamidopyrimidine-DNA glycosylase